MPTFVRLASRSGFAEGQSPSAKTDDVEKENAENASSPKHARSTRSVGPCCRSPSGAAAVGSPGSAHKRKAEDISQFERDSPLRLRVPVAKQQVSLDARMKGKKEGDDSKPSGSSLMRSTHVGDERLEAKTKSQHESSDLSLSDMDDDEWMTKDVKSYSDDEVEIITHRPATSTSQRRTIKAEDVFSSDSEVEVVESSEKSIRTARSVEGSDFEDSSDEEMITSSKKPRNGSRLTTSASRLAAMKTYSCESDEFEDEDDDIDTMAKRAEHLKSLLSDKDRILQLQLWDCGFKFHLLPHQPEAVRFVAGLPRFYPFASADHELGYENDEDEHGDDLEEMLKNDLFGRNARMKALKTVKLTKSRGSLLADDMGLGKTVQSLAGAVIRNAKREHPTRTVIVSPGEGVQNQWHTTLVDIGVCESQIEIVGEAKKETTRRRGTKGSSSVKGTFILLRRHQIMSQVRGIAQCASKSARRKALKESLLFSRLPIDLIDDLHNEYLVEHPKHKEDVEGNYLNIGARSSDYEGTAPDRMVSLMRDSFPEDRRYSRQFDMVIMDENHFLKNVCTYAGIGAILLTQQSRRNVMLTGTPYQNNERDMQAQMIYIDLEQDTAMGKFWKNATKTSNAQDVIDAVREWRENYMLRRKKNILKQQLPPLIRECVLVEPVPSELDVYLCFENAFKRLIRELSSVVDDNSHGGVFKQKELIRMLMSAASCCRQALIHPVLPHGREGTICFSSSRRDHARAICEEKTCVICSRVDVSQKAERGRRMALAYKSKQESEEEFRQLLSRDDGETEIDLDDVDEKERRRAEKRKVASNKMRYELQEDEGRLGDDEKGALVCLGSEICRAAGSKCEHYAHQGCLDRLLESEVQANGVRCPRCSDLSARLHSGSGEIFCTNITAPFTDQAGFRVSRKLSRAVELFRTIPNDEKCIVFSFFLGSLDMMEAILTHDLRVNCTRYDGDSGKDRELELQRFKSNRNTRVMLATVPSGGTGLNITEASNIIFLDRWFNPQVHDQAEARCHRIGQKRRVKCHYLDVLYTLDMVMKDMNERKKDNAKVMLAGVDLGGNSGLQFNDLTGVISQQIRSIIETRDALIQQNESNGSADAPLTAAALSAGLEDSLTINNHGLSSELKPDIELATTLGDSDASDEISLGFDEVLKNGQATPREETYDMAHLTMKSEPLSLSSTSSAGEVDNASVSSIDSDELLNRETPFSDRKTQMRVTLKREEKEDNLFGS